MRKTLLLASVAALALSGGVYAQDADDDAMMSDDSMMSEEDGMAAEGEMSSEGGMSAESDMSMDSSITVDDVMIEGDTATFSSVTIPENGYLVIHATQDGETVAPASIGHTAIMAGENTDVAVTIAYPFEESESYVAMLHSETNDNDTYDFGEGSTDVDTPVMMNEAPVTATFEGLGGM